MPDPSCASPARSSLDTPRAWHTPARKAAPLGGPAQRKASAVAYAHRHRTTARSPAHPPPATAPHPHLRQR
ncbi:hypothetical protein ebA1552 [Aromatoleum aromaticum EbN1]|uniref:Uncharacterized protein n=1 Tax=Aromatoleum aromaticum (strain DSM 19018 / LMG 30748 / EbN1) TaxID=76114 RepID=Q5P6T6_AROAE|nr:hypothetical protein ebA1552 [Aromatoleum aromaticum EbN1]